MDQSSKGRRTRPMEASRFQSFSSCHRNKLDRPIKLRRSDVIVMNHVIKELLSPALFTVVFHQLELYISESFYSEFM